MRAGHEGRQEERQSLDVVGVGVADEQVRSRRAAARQRDAELPRAGAAIEDEERAVVGAGLDTGGIPTVARGLRTGRGDRSADSPEADAD
jgi:hypothetical protein